MDDLMKLTTNLAAFGLTVLGIATAQAPAPALNTQSDKALGMVTLTSDLVLNDGRLIFKVVAYNRGSAPTELRPDKIVVTTGAGKPVPLASLAQLEDETRVALGGTPEKRPDDYATAAAMQRPAIITPSGEPDVSGYTGGEGTSTTVSAARPKKKASGPDSPELTAALEGLRAGILKNISVEPRSAAGGNVVTQAFKFSRKEERKLKLALEFAGELHQFEFEVPRQ
jgi:hypothetical protein